MLRTGTVRGPGAASRCARKLSVTERGVHVASTEHAIAEHVEYLDLTWPTPEENLACDEALLDGCDDGDGPEVLRFWEPQKHFVVVGYSNRVESEVNVAACRELGIPILRRCSGGGTVLQGPGCLDYSLILRIDSNPAVQTVTGTNHFIMEQNRAALETLSARGGQREVALSGRSEIQKPESEISVRGHTDLAIDGRKFSGNAQRRKRRAVLFHGTFLLNFGLGLIEQCLRSPSRQPAYRANRSHQDFLINFQRKPEEVKDALRSQWQAKQPCGTASFAAIECLVWQKYSTTGWTLKF